MSASQRLHERYETSKTTLCPCSGYEESVWLDWVALPEIIAVVEASELLMRDWKPVVSDVPHADDTLGFSLAALDAKLAVKG